jgi:hypothetical protein
MKRALILQKKKSHLPAVVELINQSFSQTLVN